MGGEFCPKPKLISILGLIPEARGENEIPPRGGENESPPISPEVEYMGIPVLGKLVEEVLSESIEHYKFMSNYLFENKDSIIISVLIGFIFPLLFYYYYSYRRVEVICWACNKPNTVKAKERNRFTCIYCDNFNGYETIIIKYINYII